MSRVCTVCHHEERDAIDSALVRGRQSNRAIATQHTLSEAAIRRHKDAHLLDIRALGTGDDEPTQEVDLAVLVRRLVADAHRIRRRAEEQGDLRTALAGIRELARLVELAVATGKAQPAPEQARVVRVIWEMGDNDGPPATGHQRGAEGI